MTLKNKNIIIVGMTGAVKTTIGKILSKEISRNFFDIDHEVEKVTNLKIKDFFRIYGEREFRRLERSILIKLISEKNKFVISPGAGIFCDKRLREILLKECICVFLNAKLNTLISRLKKNLYNRPKLNKEKLEDNLKQMYRERIDHYKKSHFSINVSETPILEIVKNIMEALKKYE